MLHCLKRAPIMLKNVPIMLKDLRGAHRSLLMWKLDNHWTLTCMWRWIHSNLSLLHELGLWRGSKFRRDGTVELVAWELVQVDRYTRHSSPLWTANVVRRVRAPPWNDVIFFQNLVYLPIMLALCSMLSFTYYAHFSAGIISAPL